jgi:hypothetical protein
MSTDSQYVKEEGLVMGAPTSSIFSEIYLQYLENTKIFDILVKHHVIGYFQYVDDILLDYISNVTNIHVILDTLNKLIPTMHFTIEEEADNRMNFLDNTISRSDNKISFNIHRKLSQLISAFPMTLANPQSTS